MIKTPRLFRPAAALALLALTSGCVAAAIPVLAGSVLAKKRLDKPAASPASTPIVTLPAEPEQAAKPAPALVAAELPASDRPFAAPDRALTPDAGPLPIAPLAAASAGPVSDGPVNVGPVGTGIAAFAAYAVAQTKLQPAPGTARQSVLIDPASLLDGPKVLPCGTQPLAVAIDLDPGKDTLDLNDPPAAAPGLAEALVQVRAAGVTVFWTSSLLVAEANKLYTVLRAVGLDLDGTDRVLLARKASETRQERRLAASRDWCFVALAGDRASDFEEAIDYLRDPDGPTMRAMDPLRGNGWFVTPQPID